VVEIFRTSNLTNLLGAIEKKLQTAYDELEHVVHSNWSLHKITDMELAINRYSPLSAAKYFKLPIDIINKNACINPQNIDDFCFKYAICAKLFRNCANPSRISHYTEEIFKNFNFEGLTFPTPLKEIKIFEKNNNASVNVFGIAGKQIYPLRISSNFSAEAEKTWDLLFLEREKKSKESQQLSIETYRDSLCLHLKPIPSRSKSGDKSYDQCSHLSFLSESFPR